MVSFGEGHVQTNLIRMWVTKVFDFLSEKFCWGKIKKIELFAMPGDFKF